MTIQMVLLPVFVLVGLTFALLLWTGNARRRVGNGGTAAFRDIGDEFDLPLLFYVLIALALPLRHADLIVVMLSWVFVVTRFAHAGLLVSSGEERQRSLAWFAGALVLLAMWLYFALKILLLI
jgi:hypothetical protein